VTVGTGFGISIGSERTVFLIRQIKSDWGTLVPRINVENGIKLGFLLE
jgi:hypothetical protein